MNSCVFIIVLLFLMRAATECPDDVARVVAGAARGAPYRDHAALAVGLRAIEAAPGVALDRDDAPARLFGIGDRIFDLLVGMAVSSHPSFAICELCLQLSTAYNPPRLAETLMAKEGDGSKRPFDFARGDPSTGLRMSGGGG